MQGDRVVALVKKEICKRFKVEEAYLFQAKRGTANFARLMALLLSKELSGLKLSELWERIVGGFVKKLGQIKDWKKNIVY